MSASSLAANIASYSMSSTFLETKSASFRASPNVAAKAARSSAKASDDDSGKLTAAITKLNKLSSDLNTVLHPKTWGRDLTREEDTEVALIQRAAQAQFNKYNQELQGSLADYVTVFSEVVNRAHEDLAKVTDIKGLKQAINGLSDLAKNKKLAWAADELKQVYESLEAGGKYTGKAAEVLHTLDTARLAVKQVQSAAGQSGNYLKAGADVLTAMNKLDPIPGVHDMIEYYAGAVGAIGDAVNKIQDSQAAANLSAFADGIPELINRWPDAAYGVGWANKVLGGK